MNANLDNDWYFLMLIHSGYLTVSATGAVINLHTGNRIGSRQKGNGYIGVRHCDPTGKMWSIQAHRLVYLAFYGLIKDPTLEVNHKDGVKRNNKPRNLELVSAQYNTLHALKTGLTQPIKGEDKPNSKFTDKQVVRYRRLVKFRLMTITEVARTCNCSVATASSMINIHTYRHV